MTKVNFLSSCIAAALLLSVVTITTAEPNYVRTTTYFSTDSSFEATSFSDGLGRAIQSQVHLPGGKSLISASFYDGAGRDSISIKPFVDVVTNKAFITDGVLPMINRASGKLDNITKPYSEVAYYDDPLGRTKESGAPGSDFAIGGGHSPKTWYFGIDAVDFLKTDSLADGVNGHLNNRGNEKNSLYYLTVAKDPNGKFSQSIKDLFGRTIKTWANDGINSIISENKYDILGNVVEEIAPKAGADGDSATLISSTKYTYNTLGQLIKKETPDADSVVYQYDNAGRLIKMRDGNIRKSVYSWAGYNYDDLGRLARLTLRVDGNGYEYNLQRNVYDDPQDVVAFLPEVSSDILIALKNTRGRLVASISYDYPNNKYGGTDYQVIADLFSYDGEGRVETKYKVIPGLPLQKFSFTYDLQGNVLTKTFDDGKGNPKTSMFDYDRFGKLLEAQVDNKKRVAYTYNDRNMLADKDFFQNSGSVAGQTTYEYDPVRDWVTKISGAQFESPVLFSEMIAYNEYLPNSIASSFMKQYNGNINGVRYQYFNQPSISIAYRYDEINRLMSANSGVMSNKLSEAFEYDNIGRIIKKRKGSINFTDFDQEYKYSSNTNKLTKIINKKDPGNSIPNYEYDANGNMIIDRSKKMSITYDWRNMPISFKFYSSIPNDIGFLSSLPVLSEVRMVYDASGNRVLKTTYVPTRSN